MKKSLINTLAFICIAVAGISFASCSELEGMDDANAYYSYRAHSDNFNYQEAPGPFDTAIRFSVGMDPILGGNDDKVIEACNKCYEELKPKLKGKSGKVIICKTRHPDGKQKNLKEYKF